MTDLDKIIMGDDTGDLTVVTTFNIDSEAKKAIEYLSNLETKISKQEIFKSIIKSSSNKFNITGIKPVNNPITHKQRLKRKYIDMLNAACEANNITRDDNLKREETVEKGVIEL